MSWRGKTRVVIIVSMTTLFLYDWYAVDRGGFDATISNQLYTLSQKVPLVGVLFGILTGHLFWPIYMKCPKCNYNGNVENYGKGKENGHAESDIPTRCSDNVDNSPEE